MFPQAIGMAAPLGTDFVYKVSRQDMGQHGDSQCSARFVEDADEMIICQASAQAVVIESSWMKCDVVKAWRSFGCGGRDVRPESYILRQQRQTRRLNRVREIELLTNLKLSKSMVDCRSYLTHFWERCSSSSEKLQGRPKASIYSAIYQGWQLGHLYRAVVYLQSFESRPIGNGYAY